MSASQAAPVPTLSELTAGSLMHATLVRAAPAGTPAALAALMVVHQVHGLMTDDADRYVTDLDVIDAALAGAGAAEPGRSGHALPVLTPDTPLDAALRAMSDADAGHALVRDGGHTAGIFSGLDVAALLSGDSVRSAHEARPRAARPARIEHRLAHVAARDVMHPGVVALPPTATIVELASALSAHRLHCVAVSGVRADRGGEHLVWGLATDRDLIHALARDAHGAVVADIAATEPLCVDPDDPLDLVASQLVAHGVTHAVVGTARGLPSGVVSTLDVLEVIAVGAP